MTLRIELSQNPTEEQRKAILEPLIAYNDARTGGSTSEPFALLVRDEHVTVRPSERLLLAAAHLVERVNIQKYRARVAEARQNRPELHFLVSGPWPPYTFANIELEFKTQFGVS